MEQRAGWKILSTRVPLSGGREEGEQATLAIPFKPLQVASGSQ